MTQKTKCFQNHRYIYVIETTLHDLSCCFGLCINCYIDLFLVEFVNYLPD